MSRPVTEQQQRNRDEQRRLYGAPLGELLSDVATTFEISQSKVAQLIGVSAPMVSQLSTGHRVKIGNPSAFARLQRMLELADEVRTSRLDSVTALQTLAADGAGQVLTRTSQVRRREGAAEVQQLFRAVASATELLEAAQLLEPRHPELAEVLRVYGAGRTDEATAHYQRVLGR